MNRNAGQVRIPAGRATTGRRAAAAFVLAGVVAGFGGGCGGEKTTSGAPAESPELRLSLNPVPENESFAIPGVTFRAPEAQAGFVETAAAPEVPVASSFSAPAPETPAATMTEPVAVQELPAPAMEPVETVPAASVPVPSPVYVETPVYTVPTLVETPVYIPVDYGVCSFLPVTTTIVRYETNYCRWPWWYDHHDGRRDDHRHPSRPPPVVRPPEPPHHPPVVTHTDSDPHRPLRLPSVTGPVPTVPTVPPRTHEGIPPVTEMTAPSPLPVPRREMTASFAPSGREVRPSSGGTFIPPKPATTVETKRSETKSPLTTRFDDVRRPSGGGTRVERAAPPSVTVTSPATPVPVAPVVAPPSSPRTTTKPAATVERRYNIRNDRDLDTPVRKPTSLGPDRDVGPAPVRRSVSATETAVPPAVTPVRSAAATDAPAVTPPSTAPSRENRFSMVHRKDQDHDDDNVRAAPAVTPPRSAPEISRPEPRREPASSRFSSALDSSPASERRSASRPTVESTPSPAPAPSSRPAPDFSSSRSSSGGDTGSSRSSRSSRSSSDDDSRSRFSTTSKNSR